MKKHLMLLAASAMALAACTDAFDDGTANVPADENLVRLTVSTERPDAVDTRTMVAEDGTTPMWCPDDAIGVSVLSGSSYTNHRFTNDNTDAPVLKTTFSGSTAVGDLIYTYYPYTSSGVDARGLVQMTIPAVQHPTATSFDGSADLLVGKPVAMSPGTTTIEGLQFKRTGGFVKVVINDQTNGLLDGISLNSLSITAESNLAGGVQLDIVNGELGELSADGSNTVTAEYPSAAYTIGSEGEAAFLGVYPQTLNEGSTLTISAVAGMYDIKRSIELPFDIDLKAGKITTLTVKIDAGDVTERLLDISETFPDPIFRQYVSDNIDTNKDGKLSAEEALNVNYIDVSKSYDTPDNEKIASLEGVQYFSNLQSLNCYYNKLTDLDISKNTALTNLSCQYNQLMTLDVSKNTMLTNLLCYFNRLTTLDVSKNTALKDLDCIGNQLTTLDVSKNITLRLLYCSSNQLTTLDISKNTSLVNLNCNSNQLTSLDVTQNTALEELSCASNKLTTLDVSKNTMFTVLRCDYNQLTTLDVSKHTALTSLVCNNNQLTSLDVSKNTALTDLGCRTNQLTDLDVSKNTMLTNLGCDDNKLTTLDISKNTSLVGLNCDHNQLTSLDVTQNTALKELSCADNQLTTLDVSKNTALIYLSCFANQLTDLDVSKTNLGNSTKANPLYCGNNPLKVLYLKKDWDIEGITKNRSTAFIPEQTKIVVTDGDYGEEGGAGGDTGGDDYPLNR